METEYLGLLAAAAFVAGLVDSIAGGGGLLSFPAMLFAGMPPVQAIGTSKFFSTCGLCVSTANYARKRMISWRFIRTGAVFAVIGSLLGSLTVLSIDNDWLRTLVLIFLPFAALSLLIRPDGKMERVIQHEKPKTIALATGMSFYDGFFGPGTGSFLAIGAHKLLGLNLLQATALAKPFNLISNVVALIIFGAFGKVVWPVAIPMAICNMIGSWSGSHLAMRQGSALVRKALLCVFAVLFISLALKSLKAC
ncbi:MAG: TSUP family transporter [Myxococcota bacterium]